MSGVQENKSRDDHLAFSFVVLSLQSWSFSFLQNLCNRQAVKPNKPHPKQNIIIIKIIIKQLIVLLYCQEFKKIIIKLISGTCSLKVKQGKICYLFISLKERTGKLCGKEEGT